MTSVPDCHRGEVVGAGRMMVDDRSTSTLMGKFCEYVGRGKSVAVALSDAQREMIQ